MTANEDQIIFWNEKAGRDWVELQERMDTNLSNIHAALMAFAAARPGEAVLDIGCGTGATSLALAGAVGDGIATIAAQPLQIGPLSRAEAGAATRARVVEAVREAMAAYRTAGGGIAPPMACWLVRARAGSWAPCG